MKIYDFLTKHQRASVSVIVPEIKVTQPTVSYHLKEMEKSGLLSSQKIGKEVYYMISHICPYDNARCVLD